MRLTPVTDEVSMDFAHALDVLKEYGCEGAEIRSRCDTNIADLSAERIDEAKRILDRKQLEVCCVSAPLYKCDLGSRAGRTGHASKALQRTADQQLDPPEAYCPGSRGVRYRPRQGVLFLPVR